MIDFDNQTSQMIDLALFEPIWMHMMPQRSIELILVDDDTMQSINLQTRDIDKATDVLSFPLELHPSHPLIGSIVISFDHAMHAAQTFGHSVDDELRLLFVHGLLHLLGHDHEIDNGEMRILESQIIETFHLPTSLIVRTLEE